MELSQREIADVFDVTSRTIRDWEAEGLPAVGSGRGRTYDVTACIEWRLAEERRRIEAELGERPTDADWKAARARKEDALATKHELEAQLRAGDLVEVKAVTREFEARLSQIRERLLAWPGRVAAEIAGEIDADPRAVGAALDEHVRDILTALSLE